MPYNNIVEGPSVVVAKAVAPVAAAAAVGAPAAEEVAAPTAPAAPAAPASAAPAGMYTLKLQMPDGETSFHIPPDSYILDHVDEIIDENEALGDLPYACRAGSCSACAAKVLSGTVDNSDGSFLDDDQKAAGFVLSCTSYVLTDAEIKTHVEDDLY
jgi:ferredoxin